MWKSGRVSVINYEFGTVRVEYPDTGQQSGELIVWQGRNEEVQEYSMPKINEVGICLIDENGCGFYLGSGYTTAHPVPSGANEGIFIKDYGDGTRIEYDKNSKVLKMECSGEIIIEASKKITLRSPLISVDGEQEVTGTITAFKDLIVKGTIEVTKDIVTAGISFIKHIHGGIQGGESSTKPPE